MGFLNGVLKGIRDVCDALIDDDEEEEQYEEETEEPQELDPYKRGKMFEDWALCLFPAKHFNIIHKTVGGADLDGRYTEDCVNPDYKFRDRATGQEFWVECKFRSHRGEKGNVTWTDMKHLNRYKQIQQESGIPLFVLVGIGGEPDDPNELLFFNLDKAGYTRIFYSVQGDMALEIKPHTSLGEMCEGNRFAYRDRIF